ncbi:MAG: hypothetical protein V4820_07610 [Pseudomonadota bacterium]
MSAMPGMSVQSIMTGWAEEAACDSGAIVIGMARAVVWPMKPTKVNATTRQRIRFHMTQKT